MVAVEGGQGTALETGQGRDNRAFSERVAFVSAAFPGGGKAARDSGDEGRVRPFLETHLSEIIAPILGSPNCRCKSGTAALPHESKVQGITGSLGRTG